ncbi:MAG: hypothetical protein QXU32_10760 [Nitrososphaerales archaeon]
MSLSDIKNAIEEDPRRIEETIDWMLKFKMLVYNERTGIFKLSKPLTNIADDL